LLNKIINCIITYYVKSLFRQKTGGGEKEKNSNPWRNERLNHYTNLQDYGPQNLGKKFEVEYFPHEDNAQYSLLSGKMELRSLSENYDVIQITDSQGRQHLIDPDRADCTWTVTITLEDLAHFQSATEIFQIIDREREERLAKELVAEGNVLENEKYYRYFQKNIDRMKKLFIRSYHREKGPQIKEMMQKIEAELGTEYLALLADPGIAQNFEKFLTFSLNLKQKTQTLPDVITLRQLFSEKLGTQTIYRGMMLTEEEVASIPKIGILSQGFLKKERAIHVVQDGLDPDERYHYVDHARNFYGEIMKRLTDWGKKESSLTISVSGYEPVARSVGYHDSEQLENPHKRMYVLECDVPVISLIRMENIFDYERKPMTRLKIDTFEVNEETDLQVEMFVPYLIPKEQIKSIEPINKIPVKWVRNRKTEKKSFS